MSIVVKHSSAFRPYEMKFPINWKADPYGNKNWMHHFNSLRWLPAERSLELVEELLRDFYKFHCVNKRKNPYYNELRGDHAAAIRMGVLIKLRGVFKANGRLGGVGVCERLLKEEVKNLQSPQMYRAGHNHGLMVDLALLRLIKELPEFGRDVDLDLVVGRSVKTVSSMWHPSGLTKEHSVSYQEFNLPITIDYFRTLSDLGLSVSLDLSLNSVINESKRFLGFSLKSNGEYFPLGESFRLPNVRILNEVYGSDGDSFGEARELLAPYSMQDGVYSAEDFFIVRRSINGRQVHLAATCCWNSGNHKKNDELSFSFCVDGVTIFDTPGWSAFASEAVNSYVSSEFAHSTIFVSDLPFSDAKESALGECGFSPFDFSRDACTGRHSRFKGVTVFRSFRIVNDTLLISDKLNSDKKLRIVTSRMILAKDVKVELRGANSAVLWKDGVRVDLEAVPEKDGFFMIGGSKVVSTEKVLVDDVVALDYLRVGAQGVDFSIRWGW